ncbi:unnamed protein product [Rhodiola kirilowii]
MVCRLRRSLYDLKQAPRAWFERFSFVIIVAGFSPSAHDPAHFVHTSSYGRTLLLLYANDMLITGDDSHYIFLGIEVSSTFDSFFISQEKYIRDLLDHASLTDQRTADTPMEPNVHLRPTDGEPLEDPTHECKIYYVLDSKMHHMNHICFVEQSFMHSGLDEEKISSGKCSYSNTKL